MAADPNAQKKFEAMFKRFLTEDVYATGTSSYSTADFRITVARYAKGQLAVKCTSRDGYKTRAMRLIGDGLKCRYSGRGGVYIASPRKAARLVQLHADGWDASVITGELRKAA